MTDSLTMPFMSHVKVFHKSEELQVRRRLVNDNLYSP